MNNKCLGAVLACLLTLATFAGFAVWNSHAPMAQDDFYFTTMVPDGDMEAFTYCEGRPIESFGDALANVVNVFLYDFGRWPNLLHILFVPFPPLAERVFNALVLALALWLMIRFNRAEASVSMPEAMLSVVFLWCAFPWYNNFESLAYQANYIWMTAAVLGFMLAAGRADIMRKGGYALLLLLAFAIGEGHEGFAISTGAWFAGVAFFDKRLGSLRTWGVAFALLAGFCVNLYAGTLTRLDMAMGGSYSFCGISYSLSRLVSQAWPFWLALSLCGVEIARRRTFRIESARIVYPLLFGAFANLCVVVVIQHFLRALWPLDLFSSLVAVIILSRWLGRVPAKTMAALSAVFVVCYGWWLSELVKWEKLYGAEHSAIMAAMEEGRNDRSEVYAGAFTPSGKAPWYLMGISHNQFDELYNRSWARSYYARCKGRTFLVASDESMLGDFENWPLIPGTAGARGVWPMVAMEGTTVSDHLIFTIGAPTGNETPIDKLLIRVKEGAEPADVEISLGTVYHPLRIADSAEVFAVETEPLPRTLKLRDVVRIDTISCE